MSMGASVYGGPQQLAFDFVRMLQPAVQQVSDNLYFAVLPDTDAACRMAEIGAELRDRYRLPGRVQPPRLLHISMAHVGNYADLPAHVVAAARAAGSAVRSIPFEVHFDRAMSFDNPRERPLVMRCSQGDAGFEHLRVALTTAMLRAGIHPGRAIGLTPHVTLVYNGLRIPETVLTKPIVWTVRELVLVQSLVGRGRHVHLGRWPLRA